MTREIRSTRPARAAIAAVLAFSATPLLAQEVAPSPVAPAPMTPAAESAAPPVAPVMEAPPSAPAASAPVMAPAQPVVQATPSVEDRKAEAIAQAEAASAEAAPAPVQRVQKRPAARAAAPTPVPAETVAAAPVRAIAPAPVEATPVAPDMGASTPVEPAVVTPPATNDLAQAENSNEALTWGLAGGALLLVGAAGTMAMRRRRNRAGDSAYHVDEGVTLHTSEGIVTVPETALAHEPAFTPVAPATTATRPPLAADAPHSSLAALVDAPPSPANPFLTRGNRLRRAHFLLAQQADGSHGAGRAAVTVAPQATPVDRSQTVYRFGKEDARRSGLIPRTR